MAENKPPPHDKPLTRVTAGISPIPDSLVIQEIHRLFQLMPWAVAILDRVSFDIMAVNASMTRLSGYDERTAPPGNFLELIPEFQLSDDVDSSPVVVEREYQLRRLDGTLLPVEVGSTLTDVCGRERLVVFLRDISHRKQTSEALYISRFFLDKSGGLILWVNDQGRIVYANEGAVKALGYSSNELLNMTIHQVDVNFPPSMWPVMWENFKRVQTSVLESVFRARDGRIFPVEVSGSYVKYGDQEYNFVFAWDVSRRKNAEEALRVSQRQLAAFINSATDAFYLYDAGLKLVEANPAAFALSGRTREESLGAHIFDLGRSVGFTDHADEYRRVLTEGGTINYSLATEESSGDPRYLDVKIFRVNDGIGIIAADVTERKIMEQELVLHQTRLEELVEERTAALAQVNAQLTEQIEQRRMFTHALVHDLKTPLTPLLGASEALVQGLTEAPWNRMAENVHMGAVNLNRTVSQLFDLEKGQMGLLELNCTYIDAAFVLRKTAEYARVEAQANGQRFIVDVPDDLGRVWADANRLDQTVMNLLNNAFKYTPSGGVIELKARIVSGNLRIEVCDNGLGISEDEHENIFLPYRRLKKSGARHGGLGLGLALARRLVELHHGYITVNSEEGKGSTFTVEVPVNKTDPLIKEATK
jgi:PAS domain S-box-containing protein